MANKAKNPLAWLKNRMACDSRDWGEDEMSRMLYAIICGWGDEWEGTFIEPGWKEICCDGFGWSKEKTEFLMMVHETIKDLAKLPFTTEDRYQTIKDGDTVFYADKYDGTVTKGVVDEIKFLNGEVSVIVVKFEDMSHEVFGGDELRWCLFLTEEEAKYALNKD